MTLLDTITLAQTQASDNLTLNLNALNRTQPQLHPWILETALDVEWVFARDRSLAALENNHQWYGGCSLPSRAAQAMLKNLEIKGAVGCFLAPSHAAQIQAALSKFRPEQAIVAIIPDLRDLKMILHTAPLQSDIESGRLWFVAGPTWELSLETLLNDQAGLATPTQFIRLPDATAEQTESLIGAAQKVFATINGQRNAQAEHLRQRIAVAAKQNRLLVIAPCRFRLWNDLGHAMIAATQSIADWTTNVFDADDPRRSSPTALLQATEGCGAILTSNTARTDLPGMIPETVAWITWLTHSRIPSSALASMKDRLIVLDNTLRDQAIKSGWRADQVCVGGWTLPLEASQSGEPPIGLGMICDTCALETPADLIEYSSHSLLWEALRHELNKNPFILTDAPRLLSTAMQRMNIGQDGFPQARFIEKLMIPAFQQGIARLLITEGIPLRIWGDGWEKLDEFKSYAIGPVKTRAQFHQAVNGSLALIHAWPARGTHPIEATGKPIVRAAGSSREKLLREARSALAGHRGAATASASQRLSPELFGSLLKMA